MAELPMPPAHHAGTSVPVPPASRPGRSVPPPPRAGQLTPAWRITVGVTWVMVTFAFVALWTSSRTMGLATWWLGPESDPRPIVVQLAPFVAPLTVLAAVVRNSTATATIGVGAAVGLAALAAGDLSTYTRYAAVEFVVAGAAALVSIAALGGRHRRAPATSR